MNSKMKSTTRYLPNFATARGHADLAIRNRVKTRSIKVRVEVSATVDGGQLVEQAFESRPSEGAEW